MKLPNLKFINISPYALYMSAHLVQDTLCIVAVDNDIKLKPPREAILYIKKNLKGYLVGVEVGTNNGQHAMYILTYLNCKLYAIDLWEDYEETNFLNAKPEKIKANLTQEDVENRLKNYDAEVIKGDSVEVAKTFQDRCFDFVYIDANHTYENVRQDILAWKPKVKKGGVLCGHDYTPECEGVMKAVDELLPNVISENKSVRYPDWYTVI